MAVTPLKSYAEYRTAIDQDKVTIIEFWAPWSGPSKLMSPIFEELSNIPDYANADFYRVNTDEAEDIAAEAGVKTLPYFAVYKIGVKLDDISGPDPTGLQKLVVKHAV